MVPIVPSFPTGTVVLLMSDIEGPTRLISTVGDAFPGLLGEHRAIMRKSIADQHGMVVSTEGYSFFAVFPSVRLAVNAGINAQRALADHLWPGEARVKVRLGSMPGRP